MVGAPHRPFDSRSGRHVQVLARFFCLHAVILVGCGAITGSRVFAQTRDEIPVQKLLALSDAAPATERVTPSVGGNAPAAVATPQTLSPEALGDIDIVRHKYQAAIAAYAKAPQMTAAVLDKLGVAYQMLFDNRDAARCYQQALTLDPGYADALSNLGTVYESQGQYGDAEREYRAALNAAPRSALMLKNLGTDLMVEHKYNEGWEAFQQALAMDPEIFAEPNGPNIGNSASKAGHGAVDYYTALANLRAGNIHAAIDNLRAAMDEGTMSPKKLSKDKNLATLRANPAFQRLLADEGLR